MNELSSPQDFRWVLSLPFVSLDDRHLLPQEPVIYFALDSADTLLYIGKSVNARMRWASNSHHRYEQLVKIGGVRLAYWLCLKEELSNKESALIQRFKPKFNSLKLPGDVSSREVVTLSMGAADKALLTDKAADCGYDNLSAFVRAIARGDVPLAEDGNLSRRIDKLVDRVNELQAQQQGDRDVFADDMQRLAAKL